MPAVGGQGAADAGNDVPATGGAAGAGTGAKPGAADSGAEGVVTGAGGGGGGGAVSGGSGGGAGGDGGNLGTGGMICTVVTGSGGATSMDAGAGCPSVPASTLTVKFDFTETDMGVSADLGSWEWISNEGCPSPGALEATFTFRPGGPDLVLIGTQVTPSADLTGQVLYARIKVLSGVVGLVQLVAKTGNCSIYSDGELVPIGVGDGWKVLSLDPKCPGYVNDACFDTRCQAVTCGTAVSTAYDPSRVTEIDVAVHAPSLLTATPVSVVIDTIGYGH